MIDFPILSLITFLPLIGALLIMTVKGEEKYVNSNAKCVAIFTSLLTLVLSIYMYMQFDNSSADFQFVEKRAWLSDFNIFYKLGVDGISLFFVMLTAVLTPLCIIASWDSIKKRVRDYMVAFLLLETMMIGTFLALDMVLFYIFFEGVLVPMFIIIGVWGGENRVYASFKFFLYTLLGSVLMLIALLTLYNQFGTTDIPELMTVTIGGGMQKWIFCAFLASFAIKIPMWPLHTWLPDAHVEAPTAGSVILAGILLKIGGYGFIRLALPMLPEAVQYFTPMMFTLSVIAIIYTSLVALVQEDMKKLIAYSSIAHMGFVTIGIFTLNIQGLEGAMIQMLSHGVISAALFLCVGVLYDRLKSRDIKRYGAVVQSMPHFATVFMIFTLASIGLPALSGFVGEFLVLIGAYYVNTYVAVFASIGIILSAAYMLRLYKRLMFGEVVHKDVLKMKDLSIRETAIFIPLVALVFWIGIYPSSFIEPMEPALEKVIERYNDAK